MLFWRRLVLAVAAIAAVASPAHAQTNADRPSHFDIGINVGSAQASLAAPTLGTVGGGGSIWVGEHWGVGFGASYGPGTQQFPSLASFPARIGDREDTAKGHLLLRYITLRYRRRFGPSFTVVLGAGIFGGTLDTTERIASTLTDIQTVTVKEFIGGYAYEFLLQLKLTDTLAVQGGVTMDVDIDPLIYKHPTIGLVLRF